MGQTPPLALPSASGSTPRPINQDALTMQMQAQQAPSKDGTPMFAPGAPLAPMPGMVQPAGPKNFSRN